MSELSVEVLQQTVPRNIRNRITQEFVDKINQSIADPYAAESIQENILGFSHVLAEGKWKLDSYIDAVKYVSFKLMGMTNVAAYTKTFPQRYAKFKAEGVEDKDIASYITAYNKNKLVNIIYEQSLVPTHILNAHLHQEALNVQADLMRNARSEKVRSDAANSLLTHLKRPEAAKVELDVTMKESGVIKDLHDTMFKLANQQQKLIQEGIQSPKDIAHSSIIEGECSDE